jgi:hypothetical protein
MSIPFLVGNAKLSASRQAVLLPGVSDQPRIQGGAHRADPLRVSAPEADVRLRRTV